MLRTFPEIEQLFDELFPIPRSITGKGYRESCQILSRYIPFDVGRIPSGSQVFDWVIPQEWNIDEGYLIDPDGKKVLDFKVNNLSVVNYSRTIDKLIDLDELNKYIHSLPSYPEWIPYVTSYYKENWGFCMPHNQRIALKPGKYHAVIKASFSDGYVEYGHHTLKATSTAHEEKNLVLLSSYLCHPSLANNELSGPIILAALYDRLSKWGERRFDYRFVVNPETIGSICFLHDHGKQLLNTMKAGLVITCVGGPNPILSYKKSRQGNSSLDRIFIRLAKEGEVLIRNFDPSEGSDERQYCSSEFNLPVGQIAKTTYGTNPEYHTSADNKEFVCLDSFIATIASLEKILEMHELVSPLERFEPFCEIQLGKRGLYPSINSPLNWSSSSDSIADDREQLRAIMYILSYADGNHDVVDIAELTDIKLSHICKYVSLLKREKILR